MKNALIDFLYWCLEKLEQQEIEKVGIGQHVSVDLKRIVPKNGKWYHIAMTASAWVMFEKGKDKPMMIDEIGIWKGGEKVRKNIIAAYKFDNK